MMERNHASSIELMTMTPELRHELERGLQFANVMGAVNQSRGNETMAYLQALTDVLVQKGIIEEAELEEPLEKARQEVANIELPQVRLADMGDKYSADQAVEIDCANRIPLCQARCCTFQFFLTKQDLDEGVARWDYGNPYWIRQGADGYCVHNDSGTGFCTIHAQRPHVCRQYDCRGDKRIWIDFEQRIPAPIPPRLGEAPVATAELALRNATREAQEHDAQLEAND